MIERALAFAVLLEIMILTNCCFKNVDIIKNMVLSVSGFLMLYAVAAGLFFWADKFSFVHVLGSMLAGLAPFVLYCARRYGKTAYRAVLPSYRQVLPILILTITAAGLSFSKFELFNSGQDQGLYQAEAIELYMGNYEVEHDFEEYRILESDSDKSSYREMLNRTITGFYPFADAGNYWEPLPEEERKSDVSGVYHGIQTFPALLALGGRLFGLENMVQMQTVFFVCALLLLYFANCNLQVPLGANLASLAVFLFSPLALWISKSSLTEMTLSLLMSAYLFLLTESDTRAKRLLSAFPLICFAFVHVSFLQLYPVFIGINLFRYVKKRSGEYLAANVLISLGLCAGYCMMARIAPQYFYDNCGRLYYKDIITADNFLCWIFAGSAFVCVCSLLMLRVKNMKRIGRTAFALSRYTPVLILGLLAVILRFICLIAYVRTPDGRGFTSYYGEGFPGAFTHSSLFAFAMSVGFAVFLFLLVMVTIKYRRFLETDTGTCILFLFVYCILFQSAFFRKEVFYYYYYSRYLVFYIPIICVALALSFYWAGKLVNWIALAVSLCCMLVFDVPLLTRQDLTDLEWENLLDLRDAVKDDSAIILENGAARLLGAPLRALTDAAIFPVFEDISGEVELLQKNYSHVYYIPDEVKQKDWLEMDLFALVYRDRYQSWEGMATGRLSGLFPLRFQSTVKEVLLFERQVMKEIDPEDTEVISDKLEGYYNFEGEYVWVNKESSAELYNKSIKKKGLEIDFIVPQVVADSGQGEKIGIYVNEKKVAEVPMTTGEKSVIIEPEEIPYRNDRYTVKISCPSSFVPSADGSSVDARELSLQIKYIGKVR